MERRFSKVFWLIYDACLKHPRYISNRGGTRSGKTYSILQFLHQLIPLADKAGDITSVVSESMPHLKRGAIRDFESILGHPLANDPRWNASDFIYTYPNGARLEFFSVDSSDKVLGPKRKRLLENECNHISFDTHRQLAVRTTGTIFLDYNPAAVFWCIEKVETKKNCITIKTTYLDNVDSATGESFLSPEQIEEIEGNKDDKNWWKVYGLGEIGTLEGLIYEMEQIDELPSGPEASSLKECYGMDFGFTNDPTTLMHILADTGRKILYVDQCLYRTHMKNGDIIDHLKSTGVNPRAEIYADCAEPKSIAEIKSAGFNIIACDKDAPVKSDKLKFQLLWMQGWKIYITKTSLDAIKEQRNYTWAKDKDGNLLNEPIDKWNHCLDAMRYGVWTKFAEKANKGHYSVSMYRGHGR